MHALRYFKSAFLYHWNLLLFFTGAGFCMLSGHADIAIPLLLAAELTFVGLLGSNQKYQQYVDTKSSAAQSGKPPVDVSFTLRRILAALPVESSRRFETLRNRCVELQQIALAIKDPGQAGSPLLLEKLQHEGLDRLLWIYLRLLFTEFSLERFLGMEKFLEKSGETRLNSEIADLQERLKKAAQIADEIQRQKVQRTLEDSLQTSRDRLANFQKARDNLELVRLEIERLENKIRSLSELAINRQEPDFISAQVDQVASSMLHAEKTMNDLQFATGLDRMDEDVPPLMQRETA